MGTFVSTPSPEDEQQIQEAVTAVLERLSTEKAKGLGVTLAELMEATAVKVLALTDSQEKKDRLLEVLSKHLQAQISEVSEILTADLC
jgi:multidrug efflux pump subunit AcrB